MFGSFLTVETCDIKFYIIFCYVYCVVITRCQNEMSDIKQQGFCYSNCIALYCIVLHCITKRVLFHVMH